MVPKKLAEAINKAMDIREGSYNTAKADAMERNLNYPDFSKCYELNKLEAAQKALEELNLDPKYDYIIYLLMETAWNDAHDWANQIIAGTYPMNDRAIID